MTIYRMEDVYGEGQNQQTDGDGLEGPRPKGYGTLTLPQWRHSWAAISVATWRLRLRAATPLPAAPPPQLGIIAV